MNSIISINQVKPAVVVTLLAATALYVIHTHTRRSRSNRKKKYGDHNSQHFSNDDFDDKTFRYSNNGSDFYKYLGISEENLPPHIRREIDKERRRKAKVEFISMKSPMYDNVFMLDKDRVPMCTISMKKARWYVRKGIAEWSSLKDVANEEQSDGGSNDDDEVKCIRLLFEPSGGTYQTEGTPENLYLRTAKKNICVACGDDGHHMRHYIVPYAYRTLLPDHYKSHMSHDIVILCPDCHVNCERETKRRMKEMEKILRVEMGEEDCSPVIDDPYLHHVRSCAIALVRWKESMPKDKIENYETVVRLYLANALGDEAAKKGEEGCSLKGNEDLTKAQLQKACSINYRVKNPLYVSGSEVVVASLNEDAKKIEEFVIEWRKHFIQTVKPRFMPRGWSVDNPVVCGRTDSSNDDSVKRW